MHECAKNCAKISEELKDIEQELSSLLTTAPTNARVAETRGEAGGG